MKRLEQTRDEEVQTEERAKRATPRRKHPSPATPEHEPGVPKRSKEERGVEQNVQEPEMGERKRGQAPNETACSNRNNSKNLDTTRRKKKIHQVKEEDEEYILGPDYEEERGSQQYIRNSSSSSKLIEKSEREYEDSQLSRDATPKPTRPRVVECFVTLKLFLVRRQSVDFSGKQCVGGSAFTRGFLNMFRTHKYHDSTQETLDILDRNMYSKTTKILVKVTGGHDSILWLQIEETTPSQTHKHEVYTSIVIRDGEIIAVYIRPTAGEEGIAGRLVDHEGYKH